VLLEVSGSLRLFGSLESLLGRLRRGLEDLGWSAALAGAPTPRAASWLAAAGEEKFITEPAGLESALARLRVELPSWEKETLEALRNIGVRTLGELRALPREGVARRFGAKLLDDMDRALGHRPDPRSFFVAPAKFRSDIELPAEVMQAEALLFAAKRLVAQFAGFLAARDTFFLGFLLEVSHRSGRRGLLVGIGFVRPCQTVERRTELSRHLIVEIVLRHWLKCPSKAGSRRAELFLTLLLPPRSRPVPSQPPIWARDRVRPCRR